MPIKSMTAFGRATLETDIGSFLIEVQSLNRRFLEINLSVPRLLNSFEMKMRSWVREHVGRGVVNLSITWAKEQPDAMHILPNIVLAKEMKKAWKEIAKSVDLDFEGQFSLSMLAQEKEILIYQQPKIDETHLGKMLQEGVDGALSALLEMRVREGEMLKADIAMRLKTLHDLISQMEKQAENMLGTYREKLKKRLEELFEKGDEQDERIAREVALLAERSDYTEEIVRLRSHLEQMSHLLTDPLLQPNETRGKKLEFLLQELARELNTIGSKTTSAKTQHLVVAAKGEVEKIREQAQNIE